ncbi:MAG: hypothetical protein AB4290_27300 [Spirulina sp.]
MFEFSRAIAALSSLLFFLGCTNATSDRGQSSPVKDPAIVPKYLISTEGIGAVKFGMTFGEVKEVLGEKVEYVLESPYIVDADAIAVRQDGKALFYIIHSAGQPLGDKSLVTFLQTNNPTVQTPEGVHAGMSIQEAEKIYGEATLFTSEIESRESVNFQNQPEDRIYFGTFGGGAPIDANVHNPAGIYPDGSNQTKEYREDAIVQHISVSCNLDICWENY